MWGRVIWHLLPSFRKNLRLRLFWNSMFLRSGSNRSQNYTASSVMWGCVIWYLLPSFRRNLLPRSETVRSFEVVVTEYQTTRHHVMWGRVIWYMLPSFRMNILLRQFWNSTFLRSGSTRPPNYTASCHRSRFQGSSPRERQVPCMPISSKLYGRTNTLWPTQRDSTWRNEPTVSWRRK
jgi:hypothetical protein